MIYYKIKGNSTKYPTKTAIIRDLCVSYNWVNSMIESGKITKVEEKFKKRSPTNTKHQVFYFKEHYGKFKVYHCTIDEFVKQKGISKNKMYSLIKAGLLEKSKSEISYTKSKVSDKTRKRIIRQYVLECAQKGVPLEINI